MGAHSQWHIGNMISPRLLLFLVSLLRVCPAELSEPGGKPSGWGALQAHLSGAGGEPAAAECGFLARGSDHMNLTSLGKWPQFRYGPQSDFVSLIPV